MPRRVEQPLKLHERLLRALQSALDAGGVEDRANSLRIVKPEPQPRNIAPHGRKLRHRILQRVDYFDAEGGRPVRPNSLLGPRQSRDEVIGRVVVAVAIHDEMVTRTCVKFNTKMRMPEQKK
jgi:hypothetical protein